MRGALTGNNIEGLANGAFIGMPCDAVRLARRTGAMVRVFNFAESRVLAAAVPSPEVCAENCLERPGCLSFDYGAGTQSRRCYLGSGVEGVHADLATETSTGVALPRQLSWATCATK